MSDLKCTTCGMNLIGQEDFVKFECPKCGESVVIRCGQCRKLSTLYKCLKCEFEGP
ncbi:MAG: DUF1610 domain-containing protein [Candidatus Aenigmarchaeota archaeon]|nr:DUF1610 domain-containing protein [Candidatus Aenigmarchaeota archaeon]